MGAIVGMCLLLLLLSLLSLLSLVLSELLSIGDSVGALVGLVLWVKKFGIHLLHHGPGEGVGAEVGSGCFLLCLFDSVFSVVEAGSSGSNGL